MQAAANTKRFLSLPKNTKLPEKLRVRNKTSSRGNEIFLLLSYCAAVILLTQQEGFSKDDAEKSAN